MLLLSLHLILFREYRMWAIVVLWYYWFFFQLNPWSYLPSCCSCNHSTRLETSFYLNFDWNTSYRIRRKETANSFRMLLLDRHKYARLFKMRFKLGSNNKWCKSNRAININLYEMIFLNGMPSNIDCGESNTFSSASQKAKTISSVLLACVCVCVRMFAFSQAISLSTCFQ